MNPVMTYGQDPWGDNQQHIAVAFQRADEDSFYVYPPDGDVPIVNFLLKDRAAAETFMRVLMQVHTTLKLFLDDLDKLQGNKP